MRLAVLAVTAVSFLLFAVVSLQMQVQRTQSQISISGNTGAAFNTSRAVLSDGLTSLGVSTPGFFLVGVVALVGVLLVVVLR